MHMRTTRIFFAGRHPGPIHRRPVGHHRTRVAIEFYSSHENDRRGDESDTGPAATMARARCDIFVIGGCNLPDPLTAGGIGC